MATLDELADRIERLVLRHDELKRTNALLEEKLAAVGIERDNLKSRLAAARACRSADSMPSVTKWNTVPHPFRAADARGASVLLLRHVLYPLSYFFLPPI